jgi:hypothetical protein
MAQQKSAIFLGAGWGSKSAFQTRWPARRAVKPERPDWSDLSLSLMTQAPYK